MAEKIDPRSPSRIESLRGWLVWAGVLLVSATGCSGTRVDGDEWGDPGRSSSPPTKFVLLDGGGDGAHTDGSARDGGATAIDGSPGSVDGPPRGDGPAAAPDGHLAGGPTVDGPTLPSVDASAPLTACQACENRSCRQHPDYGDLVALCFTEDPANPRKIGSGPTPNALVSDACKAVVECVRSTRCAGPPDVQPMNCYCGTAKDTDCLDAKKVNGPCQAQIEAASGSTNPTIVTSGLFNTKTSQGLPNAAGIAMALTICDNYLCSPPCLNYNACVVDVSDTKGLGSPLCDTPACKNEGQCNSRENCYNAGFCPTPDEPADTGVPMTSLDAAADQTALPPPADAPLADVSGSSDAIGADRGDGGSEAGGGAMSWLTSAACLQCEKEKTTIVPDSDPPFAECEIDSGCEKLPAGADRDLCQGALTCIRASGCWLSDTAGVLDGCYCGTNPGTACFTRGSPNGPCKAAFEAAAKTDDPQFIGENFFVRPPDPKTTPLTYAVKLAACDHDSCKSPCTGPVDAGSAPAPDAQPDLATPADTSAHLDLSPDLRADAQADAGSATGGTSGTGGASGAGGASGTGGVVGGGTGGAAGTGGSTADAARPDGPVSECPDLDGDGTLDCRQTLVVNPGFTSGVAPWGSGFAATEVADSRDGNGNAGSGALAVTNTFVDGSFSGTAQISTGSSQCIPAVPDNTYGIMAQVFVPAGQGSDGGGAVGLQFFAGDNCSGAVLASGASLPSVEAGVWKTVRIAVRSPAPVLAPAPPAVVRSLAINLLVQKPYNKPPLTVLFDNVLVKKP